MRTSISRRAAVPDRCKIRRRVAASLTLSALLLRGDPAIRFPESGA
jgi:hypothetical protein